MLRMIKIITLSVCAAAIASGCKFHTSSAAVKGYVSEGDSYRWPNATAAVCWEDKDPALKAVQDSTQQLVTSEYARAGFTFTGWDYCTADSKGIRIQNLENAAVKTQSFGYRLDGVAHGMLLNLTYQTNKELCTSTQTSVCANLDALHEFGHAIGLRHEANRPDSPCWTDQTAGQGEDGALAVGDYDKDSIMNYCGEIALRFNRGSVTLSDGDIKTIKAYYTANADFFTGKKSCEGDGNTWQESGLSACCQVQSSGKLASVGKRGYAYCNELKDTAGSDAGQWHTLAYVNLPPTSFKPMLAILRCDEQDFWSQKFQYGASSNGSSLRLLGPTSAPTYDVAAITMDVIVAKKNDVTFHCSGIELYDAERGRIAANLAKVTFASSQAIKMDGNNWPIDASAAKTEAVSAAKP